MPFVWDKSLATGVADVDHQHQEIFHRIDALGAAMKAGKGRDEIGRVLEFLTTYTVDHFTKEEAMMARYRCPVAEANKAAHRQFVERLGAIRKRFAAAGAQSTMAIDIYTELTTWLTKHIRGIDAQLAASIDEAKLVGAGA